METAIVPGIYDPTLADEDCGVSTEARARDGAPAGARGGAARRHFVGRRARGDARRSRARLDDAASIVTVFPDGAEKYLTESFWTAE